MLDPPNLALPRRLAPTMTNALCYMYAHYMSVQSEELLPSPIPYMYDVGKPWAVFPDGHFPHVIIPSYRNSPEPSPAGSSLADSPLTSKIP